MRRIFDDQIQALLEDLLEMGHRVADSIQRSIEALARQDVDLARDI